MWLAWPQVHLWSVKVLDNQAFGYHGGILAGIDWVVARGDIEVINMSLGGEGQIDAYEVAINNARNNGVIVVVAAGNENDDARNYSPAFVPNAITVSALADFDGLPAGNGSPTCATDVDDTLAYFSNYGPAIDIAAPGLCINSTLPNGTYGIYSGTSMASPHVAGAAALLASGVNPPQTEADVDQIRDTILNSGNFNWTDDSSEIPRIQEPLLDLASLIPGDGGGDTGPTPNTPPTADFTHSCTDLSCSFTDTSNDSDGSITAWYWEFGDGSNSTAQNPNHSYAAEGTYTVSLMVTDDDGATDSISKSVAVTEPAPNVAPTADFSFSTADLTANFTDTSMDTDGTIVSWSWMFGDGATSTAQNPNHTYASAGSYTATLTVTDDDGATDTTSQSVTVEEPSGTVLSITGMSPDTIQNGSTMSTTISGTGFENGATIIFSGGNGPTPLASNIVVVDSQTMTATITAKDGGPPRNRYWNVTVTNPDGSSAVLENGLMVTP